MNRMGLFEYAIRRALLRPRHVKPEVLFGGDLLIWDDLEHSRLLTWWLRRRRRQRRVDVAMTEWFAEFQARRPVSPVRENEA